MARGRSDRWRSPSPSSSPQRGRSQTAGDVLVRLPRTSRLTGRWDKTGSDESKPGRQASRRCRGTFPWKARIESQAAVRAIGKRNVPRLRGALLVIAVIERRHRESEDGAGEALSRWLRTRLADIRRAGYAVIVRSPPARLIDATAVTPTSSTWTSFAPTPATPSEMNRW